MSSSRQTQSAYLPAEAIMALGKLQIRARAVADGVLAGLHFSQRRGESAEFAEHKLYSPGDDLRRVDWKALAKSDRYYVKRFVEETSLSTYIVLDRSASMAYPEQPGNRKFDYAATLAAALAMLLLRQGDPVGLIHFSSRSDHALEARVKKSQLFEFINKLEELPVVGTTAAADVFAELGQGLKRKSLVLVLSDMLDVCGEDHDPQGLMQSLGSLRARGADVALMQVLHPDELSLPFQGLVRFLDMESDAELQVDADAIRASYQQEIQGYVQKLRRSAQAADVRFASVSTAEPPAQVLANFIAEGRHLRWN